MNRMKQKVTKTNLKYLNTTITAAQKQGYYKNASFKAKDGEVYLHWEKN